MPNYDTWRHYYPDLLAWEYDLISKGWTYVSSGRHRRVIKRGNVVIKIPYQPDGKEANQDEYQLYRKYRNSPDPRTGVYYAPCRMLLNGCLMMRAINTKLNNKAYRKLPLWAFELSDGPQVGFDKNGRVLAYDYSEERLYSLSEITG